jgi:hypothetical protein
MESGRDDQLPHGIRNYTFPGNLGGGVFTNSYLAVENQGDDGVDAHPKSVSPSGLDPAEALRHLQLPEDDYNFKSFTQLLKEIGYDISPEVAGKSKTSRREYTKALGRESFRALLYIPKEILSNPNPDPAILDSIFSICSVFTKEAILIVFSKLDDYPHREIRRIIKQDWPEIVQLGNIVPWKDVIAIIADYDSLRNERNFEAKRQILEDIKKEIENMLEGLKPLKDS